MVKIKMLDGSQGIAKGEVIDVSEERAARWCLTKKIAVFVDKKEKAAVVKKVEEAEAKAEEEQKELLSKLDEAEKE